MVYKTRGEMINTRQPDGRKRELLVLHFLRWVRSMWGTQLDFDAPPALQSPGMGLEELVWKPQGNGPKGLGSFLSQSSLLALVRTLVRYGSAICWAGATGLYLFSWCSQCPLVFHQLTHHTLAFCHRSTALKHPLICICTREVAHPP